MSSFVEVTAAPQVVCLDGVSGLGRIKPAWNRLADGMPLRRWEWADAWWRRYGASRRLHTLLLTGGGEHDVLGVVPLYLESSWHAGRVLRLLNTGDAGVDHGAILALPGWERPVAETAALWLAAQARFQWDFIELPRLESRLTPNYWFLHTLEQVGFRVLRDLRRPRWRIALTSTWNAFLQWLPAETRTALRSAEQQWLATGRVSIYPAHANGDGERDSTMTTLLSHATQLRGEQRPADIHSIHFRDFFADMSRRLMHARQLHLWRLNVDGRPAGAWCGCGDGQTLYSLVSGLMPGLDADSLQIVLLAHVIRRAIEQGYDYLDLGYVDDRHALAWRAEPQPVSHVEVVAPYRAAQWRFALRHSLRQLRSGVGAAVARVWRTADRA